MTMLLTDVFRSDITAFQVIYDECITYSSSFSSTYDCSNNGTVYYITYTAPRCKGASTEQAITSACGEGYSQYSCINNPDNDLRVVSYTD